MNEDQLAQLELEAAIGHRAKSAYDGYLKEYVEIQNKELYERFISDSVSTQEAINIKIYKVLLMLGKRHSKRYRNRQISRNTTW